MITHGRMRHFFYHSGCVVDNNDVVTIICIAGASGSGKTELSKLLSRKLKEQYNQDVNIKLLLKVDNYYLSRDAKEHPDPVKYSNETDFDTPAQLDLDKLVKHIKQLAAGHDIFKPQFEFKSNQVQSKKRKSPPKVIIVEGLFALHIMDQLKDLNPIGVFVKTSNYEDTLKRRYERDLKGARGERTLEELKKREHEKVGPAYQKFILPTERKADIVVLNDKDHILDNEGNVIAKGDIEQAGDYIVDLIHERIINSPYAMAP